MPQELKQEAGLEVRESYYLALPDVTWTYAATSDAFTRSRLMYRVLRAWAYAARYGFKVRGVMYRGKPLSKRELERVNLWIRAGGAAEAAKMEHWEAVKLFERIVQGDG